MYGAYRPADDGQLYWRIAQFLFPFYAMIPTGVLGLQVLRARVGADGRRAHDVLQHGLAAVGRHASPAVNAPATRRRGRARTLLPNTHRLVRPLPAGGQRGNDYQIDRDKQRRSEDYTGIPGIHTQDQAITESMGPIYDRSRSTWAPAT